MPRTPMQMWLARAVVIGALVMFVLVKTIGFGDVRRIETDTATLYAPSSIGSVVLAVMALLACLVAVMYWRQGNGLFRFFGLCLAAVGVFGLVDSPSVLSHRVLVTQDYFERRVGKWYAPVEQHVDFENVLYMRIDEVPSTRKGRRDYELQCFIEPPGRPIVVPIFDMMEAAMPEIFRRAAEHDIVIGETADGWQIPPELWE